MLILLIGTAEYMTTVGVINTYMVNFVGPVITKVTLFSMILNHHFKLCIQA